MLDLHERTAHGGKVEETVGGWMMSIPAGPEGVYRWAQIDDHLHKKRKDFPWQPPVSLELQARVSNPEIRGTWGFGFWNDPFSMSFRLGGAAQKFPALPNSAWFFFASPPNYLAFRNDRPAQHWLAAAFRSPRIPLPLLALGAPLVPFLALPATARLLRKAATLFIKEDGVNLDMDVTKWHGYRMDWLKDCVRFFVDGVLAYETRVSPTGRLGLVIWVDNQYVAFPPSGKLKMGTLRNEQEEWMEIGGLSVSQI